MPGVYNGSVYRIKDIEWICFMMGRSGTPLSIVKKIVYQAIPAKPVLLFAKTVREGFNVGFEDTQLIAGRATLAISSFWRAS